MHPRAAIIALLIVCPLPAQTFIVDQARGPGWHFASLAQAAAIVPNGSTLLVRSGTYSATLVRKGMTILADVGSQVDVSFSFQIQDLGANQAVTLRGVRVPGRAFFVTNCLGPVLIDGALDIQAGTTEVTAAALNATNGQQVTLRNARLVDGGVFSSRSNLALDGCEIRSRNWAIGEHGVELRYSTLHVSRCRIHGGDGIPQSTAVWRNGDGINSINGRVRVVGNQTVIRPGSTPFGGGTGITGTGQLRIVPSLLASTSISWPFGAAAAPMPSVQATGATLGGRLTTVVESTPGQTIALVVGPPAWPATVPGIDGPLWIAADAACTVALGPAPMTVQTPVPLSIRCLGARFVWQAVSMTSPICLASNPAAIALDR